MKFRNLLISSHWTLIACAIPLLLGATITVSANAHDAAAPSKEMREKMAVVHEQMAACLRSDKTVADCHTQTLQACREMIKNEKECPMMGMHDHGIKKHAMHSAESN